MSKAPMWIAFSLLAVSGPAAAQAPNPGPGPSEERPAAPLVTPEKGLDLRLDNAARYTRETPREVGGSTDALPPLGSNARPIPTTPTPTTTRPFPEDTERMRR